MQITIHVGAHRTDQGRLMKSLMRNSLMLSRAGIFVPGPSRYRELLPQVAGRLAGAEANPETLDLLLDSLLDTTDADHIVLSYENFLCWPAYILADKGYYARAGRKCLELRNAFPGHKVRFALGLRNPAAQVPAVFGGLRDFRLADFLRGVDPLDYSWLGPVQAISDAVPDAALIVWCNEDTPLIWPEVLKTVAGYPEEAVPRGGHDILSRIMVDEGMSRFRAYLESHPSQTPEHRRRVAAAFLDKYAKADELEEEIDIPGWDDALIERISARYEQDCQTIAALPGVTFIEG